MSVYVVALLPAVALPVGVLAIVGYIGYVVVWSTLPGRTPDDQQHALNLIDRLGRLVPWASRRKTQLPADPAPLPTATTTATTAAPLPVASETRTFTMYSPGAQWTVGSASRPRRTARKVSQSDGEQ